MGRTRQSYMDAAVMEYHAYKFVITSENSIVRTLPSAGSPMGFSRFGHPVEHTTTLLACSDSDYKFWMQVPGYVTEKMINSLLAQTIPIYIGANDIEGSVQATKKKTDFKLQFIGVHALRKPDALLEFCTFFHPVDHSNKMITSQ